MQLAEIHKEIVGNNCCLDHWRSSRARKDVDLGMAEVSWTLIIVIKLHNCIGETPLSVPVH